jgi:cell division protein YceG involved in septum cleavage
MLSDYKDKFKPGTYLLDTSMTPSEMFAVMCADTGEDEE